MLRGCSQGLKTSFPKILSGLPSLLVAHPSEAGRERTPSLPAKVAFPNGAGGRKGASSLHLLPIECFLSPEPTGLSPGSPNQEHLERRQLKRDKKREAGLQFGKGCGQQGAFSLRILPLPGCPPSCCQYPNRREASRPALMSDSRWGAGEQMVRNSWGGRGQGRTMAPVTRVLGRR